MGTRISLHIPHNDLFLVSAVCCKWTCALCLPEEDDVALKRREEGALQRIAGGSQNLESRLDAMELSLKYNSVFSSRKVVSLALKVAVSRLKRVDLSVDLYVRRTSRKSTSLYNHEKIISLPVILVKSWILHVFQVPASAKHQAANQLLHPEARVSPRSQTIRAQQLSESSYKFLLCRVLLCILLYRIAKTFMSRFIDEQLKLEEEAREALPYVRHPSAHTNACLPQSTEI